MQNALLAAEDRNFYHHYGVDLVAVARAMLSNATHLRVVSGASTITMQLARTLRPHAHSVWGKLQEAALALRIEASFSKAEILEAYLNRVSYGPNLRGYAAASYAYWGVPPSALSLAQAALIAGLPRGPTIYAVTRRPELAKRRRDRVLTRMASAGMVDDAAKERAMAEPVVAALSRPRFGAPHFVRALVGGNLAESQPDLRAELSERQAISELTTTIDPELQRAAETAVPSALAALADRHVTAGAVVAIDNASGDVLAYVGSPDFFDEGALGQNDGVRALRQPGSSLKPFVYAEAMSTLGYTGATLLPDVEIHIPLPGGGDYVPHDYDNRWHGPIRLREALGNSLNIPAVYALHQVGTARVLARLHAFGFASLTEDAEHYGPALALGDGEVTLLELANAYATLARGGAWRPLRMVSALTRGDGGRTFAAAPSTRVLDARSAAMLTDILSDRGARTAAFGDQNVLEFAVDVAAKTGTSKGYRDNVAVGFTRQVTVAAWAGNFDGTPMAEVSGVSGAGPIFHAVMEAAIARRGAGSLGAMGVAGAVGLQRTAVCALSGAVAGDACPHRVYEWLPESDAEHAPRCTVHERVLVDVRNGLPAGPACERENTEARVFERWSDPYASWAASAGRPLLPAKSSPECPVASAPAVPGSEARPHIAYPFDGAKFILDPERPRELQVLEIRVDPFVGPVQVRVDDEPVPGPHQWPLTPGSHTLTAWSGNNGSAPVRITVR